MHDEVHYHYPVFAESERRVLIELMKHSNYDWLDSVWWHHPRGTQGVGWPMRLAPIGMPRGPFADRN